MIVNQGSANLLQMFIQVSNTGVSASTDTIAKDHRPQMFCQDLINTLQSPDMNQLVNLQLCCTVGVDLEVVWYKYTIC